MRNSKSVKLEKCINRIFKEMDKVHYSTETIKLYRRTYNRLFVLAKKMNKTLFDDELAQAFIEDSLNQKTGKYCHSRFLLHSRCINFLQTLIKNGSVDWLCHYKSHKKIEIATEQFNQAFKAFNLFMIERDLSHNTIDGYKRFVYYFIRYCEDKEYTKLEEIELFEIVNFLELMCQEHYQPTSIGAHLPGLKLFLSLNNHTNKMMEKINFPLLKKSEIIPIITEKEYKKLTIYLSSGALSSRNTAICWLSLEVGLRAVDICNLKLKDIDWKNNFIHISQQKTNKSYEIPLRITYGNAIMDYLINERPISDSVYLFLIKNAPFHPIKTHAACYEILRSAFHKAGILKANQICGTRFTRHIAASHMLRKGISLIEISALLGHSNPNSASIYITTDEDILSSCTLPLPGKIKEEI